MIQVGTYFSSFNHFENKIQECKPVIGKIFPMESVRLNHLKIKSSRAPPTKEFMKSYN